MFYYLRKMTVVGLIKKETLHRPNKEISSTEMTVGNTYLIWVTPGSVEMCIEYVACIHFFWFMCCFTTLLNRREEGILALSLEDMNSWWGPGSLHTLLPYLDYCWELPGGAEEKMTCSIKMRHPWNCLMFFALIESIYPICHSSL